MGPLGTAEMQSYNVENLESSGKRRRPVGVFCDTRPLKKFNRESSIHEEMMMKGGVPGDDGPPISAFESYGSSPDSSPPGFDTGSSDEGGPRSSAPGASYPLCQRRGTARDAADANLYSRRVSSPLQPQLPASDEDSNPPAEGRDLLAPSLKTSLTTVGEKRSRAASIGGDDIVGGLQDLNLSSRKRLRKRLPSTAGEPPAPNSVIGVKRSRPPATPERFTFSNKGTSEVDAWRASLQLAIRRRNTADDQTSSPMNPRMVDLALRSRTATWLGKQVLSSQANREMEKLNQN